MERYVVDIFHFPELFKNKKNENKERDLGGGRRVKNTEKTIQRHI